MTSWLLIAATVIVCPVKIVTEQRPAPLPEGWETFVDAVNDQSLQFVGVEAYDGPPVELGQLRPDEVKGKKGHSRSTWGFSGDRDAYVACTYRKTNVKLVKNLGRKVKTCEVEGKDRKITCK